jgi:hypothetical protein
MKMENGPGSLTLGRPILTCWWVGGLIRVIGWKLNRYVPPARAFFLPNLQRLKRNGSGAILYFQKKGLGGVKRGNCLVPAWLLGHFLV